VRGLSHKEEYMSKRVFRPFNTWGLVLIGFIVVSVLGYSLAAL